MPAFCSAVNTSDQAGLSVLSLTQGSQYGQGSAAFPSSVVALLTWRNSFEVAGKDHVAQTKTSLGISLFCAAALKPQEPQQV